MSVIGEFTIPPESFALEHALSTVPEMTLQADRLASHGPDEVFPFIWATGGDFESFQQALEEDPTTTAVSVADEMGDEVLYRLEWSQDFLDLVREMVDHHAAMLETKAADGQWRLRLRFAEEEMVSEFQTYFREHGHRFEVHELTHPREPRQREYGLSTEQYDALVAAVRGGYFQVPRGTSVGEIGEHLGISSNATSQRIRRGAHTVLRTALTLSDDTDERS